MTDTGAPSTGEISIHALREEGDPCVPPSPPLLLISIHALREEGDQVNCVVSACCLISIHALREEGDTCPLKQR